MTENFPIWGKIWISKFMKLVGKQQKTTKEILFKTYCNKTVQKSKTVREP